MIQNGSLLPNCNREGFNVRPLANTGSPGIFYTTAYNTSILRARFGILTNNEADCTSPDAVIGFGLAGIACKGGGDGTNNTAGNLAYCGSSPNNNQNYAAWAYVFVR